jgi:hypothetical protein
MSGFKLVAKSRGGRLPSGLKIQVQRYDMADIFLTNYNWTGLITKPL